MDAVLSSALEDLVVLEIGDERGEFAGMLLAMLGAEVIRIEGRQGSSSRQIGPFAKGDGAAEQSLCFARYNLGKKSISLEFEHQAAASVRGQLGNRADVVIDSGNANDVARRLNLCRAMQKDNQQLIVCTLTPFGLDGPYRDLRMTDLTQLAMGGVMASCGYDPRPDGTYETPPIAPAMWQAYHIAGAHAVMAIFAALSFREAVGHGDLIDLSIHQAVSNCTEVAIPSYVYNHAIVQRQTGRHAAEHVTRPWLRRTSDGRYVKAFMFWSRHEARVIGEMLNEAGIEHDLGSDAYRQLCERSPSAGHSHLNELVDKLAASMTADELFHRAQAKGLLWASVRAPEDNIADPHFQARGTFQQISTAGAANPLYYPASLATDGNNPLTAFKRGAPVLGEHTHEVLTQLGVSEAEIKVLAESGAI
ncbi:MAG TPA: CaiB/BaiF CoA-transferase family protein [Candidatus Binataceae bacterium]|nr:CaiB/BaiF CoA-transferase family protein [Candidatus Binataceae bacterium]